MALHLLWGSLALYALDQLNHSKDVTALKTIAASATRHQPTMG
jgi:hypothetical protein